VDKKIENQDSRDRNVVEGKFGEGKRAYGLGKLTEKLKKTSEECHPYESCQQT